MVALTLSAPGPAVAGGEVEVTVTASAPVDGVRLALLCHEAGTEPRVVRTVAVDRVVGRIRVPLAVPDDAPPTVPDLVGWRVRAEADGASPGEVALGVRAERPAGGQAGRYDGRGTGAGELRLEFEHGAPIAFAGEPLKATLVIASARRLVLDGVRVGLLRLRGDADGQRPAEPAGGGRVGGAVKVRRNAPQRIPLEIPLPDDAPPTFAAEHHWTRYELGISASPRRSWQRDLALTVDLFVAGPRGRSGR